MSNEARNITFQIAQGTVAKNLFADCLRPVPELQPPPLGMQTRMADLTHVGTLVFGRMHAALFELMCGDHARGATNAVEVARLAREHDLPMFHAFGVFLQGWATAESGAIDSDLLDMRRGVEQLREQNVLIFDGLLKIALAEAEARAGDPDRALAILDEALATCDRTGYRAFEAELHRVRAEILLKRDPADPAPAEEAYQTAKVRGVTSFLRPSRSPSSINRPAARSKRTPSSRPRSKASRQHPNCLRSPRRRRCWRRWRRRAK